MNLQNNAKKILVVGILLTLNPVSSAKAEESVLNEIVIKADPFNPNLLEHTSPVSIMEQSEITKKAEPTLGQTLFNEPGVSSTYFGPGASRPVIRGNSGERVRILKNGVGTLDISNTSEDHAVSSNPLSASSVEVLRGPETLLYGSSAIGGVVNVTDNSIPQENIGKVVSGAADFRHGLADEELTGALKLEGQLENFNWHIDGFHQDTDNIDIPGFAESKRFRAMEESELEEHHEDIHSAEEEVKGSLPNSFTGSRGLTLGGSYVWDKGYLGLAVNTFDSRYGVPGHAHEEADHHEEDLIPLVEEEQHGEEESGVAIDLEQTRVDVSGKVEDVTELFKKVKFNLGYSSYEHKELEDGAVGTTFENDAVESRVELSHGQVGPVSGILGLQLRASDFSALGEEAFLPQTETFSPAFFLFEELPLNSSWKLQAGSRYEFVNYDASGFSNDEYHPFGLSTGVSWDPTGKKDYAVGLSFSYAERAPAATELYADGAHVARQIFEVGDTGLDMEKSYGVDLTFKRNTGFVTGVVNAFAQNYDDYIDLRGTAIEEEGFRVHNYENVQALFWGFEAESTLHLHELFKVWEHDLDLKAQYDFVRGENHSDDQNISRIPPMRTILSFDYKYKKLFGVNVEGVFVQEQDKVAEFELPTDNYQLLNARFDLNLKVTEDYQTSFYVLGSNLTDEEARVHSSFLKDQAPLRSRSLLFGIRATF